MVISPFGCLEGKSCRTFVDGSAPVSSCFYGSDYFAVRPDGTEDGSEARRQPLRDGICAVTLQRGVEADGKSNRETEASLEPFSSINTNKQKKVVAHLTDWLLPLEVRLWTFVVIMTNSSSIRFFEG